MNMRSATPALLALALAAASPTAAQNLLVIPIQAHNTLSFELHSVKDDVQLYLGDTQNLLKLELRPYASFMPIVEFSNPRQEGRLQVRDLSLFDRPLEPAPSDEDEFEEEPETQAPDRQEWVLQLAPAAPTDFVMQCDGGKGDFDFTDLPVQSLHLLADSTRVKIRFGHPNATAIERLKLTVRYGTLDFHDILNARLQLATLQVDGSKCTLDFTGKPPGGTSEVFVEGVPKSLRVSVSRRIGLHVEGTVATVLQFDRDGMVRQEMALETADFATQPAQLRLHFSRAIPKLEVNWSD
jgi:hypothetical protein